MSAAFTDHRRWWIFRAIWWYVVPPATSGGINRVDLAERFNTYDEAHTFYLSRVNA